MIEGQFELVFVKVCYVLAPLFKEQFAITDEANHTQKYSKEATEKKKRNP